MAKRKRIPLGKAPTYPTDIEAKYYASLYMENFLPLVDCRKGYNSWIYDTSMDILCTWGCKNIFFVFAYPPAGFVIAKPEDVLQLQTFEGWILQYQAQGDIFNLLVKASRDGVDYFWSAHKKYKSQ